MGDGPQPLPGLEGCRRLHRIAGRRDRRGRPPEEDGSVPGQRWTPPPPAPITTPPGCASARRSWTLTSKVHLAADRKCRPLTLVLTAGQAADSPQFVPVLQKVRVCPPVGRPWLQPHPEASLWRRTQQPRPIGGGDPGHDSHHGKVRRSAQQGQAAAPRPSCRSALGTGYNQTSQPAPTRTINACPLCALPTETPGEPLNGIGAHLQGMGIPCSRSLRRGGSLGSVGRACGVSCADSVCSCRPAAAAT